MEGDGCSVEGNLLGVSLVLREVLRVGIRDGGRETRVWVISSEGGKRGAMCVSHSWWEVWQGVVVGRSLRRRRSLSGLEC